MKKSVLGIITGLLFFYGIFFLMFNFDSGFPIGAVIAPAFMIVFFGVIVSAMIRKAKTMTGPTYQDRSKYYYDNDTHHHSQDSNLVPCVECKKMIDKSYDYCPSCGAPQKNTIICQYCGHENPKTNALCEKCNGFL